jgi:hypothetical protein
VLAVVAISTAFALVTPFVAAILNVEWIVLPVLAFAAGSAVGIGAGSIDILRRGGAGRWLVLGYRWANAYFEYAFDESNPDQQSHLVRIEIQAVRSGVEVFENRLRPTASSPGELVVQSPGHKLLGAVSNGSWTYYFVHLGRELRFGERETIVVSEQLSDDKHTFQSFLSKQVVEPIGHIHLRVAFSSRRCPDRVRHVEYDGPTPNGRQVSSTWTDVTQKRDAEWMIPHPKKDHRYAIEWDWPPKSGQRRTTAEEPPSGPIGALFFP